MESISTLSVWGVRMKVERHATCRRAVDDRGHQLPQDRSGAELEYRRTGVSQYHHVPAMERDCWVARRCHLGFAGRSIWRVSHAMLRYRDITPLSMRDITSTPVCRWTARSRTRWPRISGGQSVWWEQIMPAVVGWPWLRRAVGLSTNRRRDQCAPESDRLP